MTRLGQLAPFDSVVRVIAHLVRVRKVDSHPTEILVQLDWFLSDLFRLLVRLDHTLLDLVCGGYRCASVREQKWPGPDERKD